MLTSVIEKLPSLLCEGLYRALHSDHVVTHQVQSGRECLHSLMHTELRHKILFIWW